MAIPDKDALLEVTFGDSGSPFVNVVGKSSITTLGVEYGLDGAPFIAAEGGGSGPAPIVGVDGYIAVTAAL